MWKKLSAPLISILLSRNQTIPTFEKQQHECFQSSGIFSGINQAKEIKKTSLSKKLSPISILVQIFLWFDSRISTLQQLLTRLEELNRGEYGPFVCAICTFCTLKPRVTLDIVLSQSLSNGALCIRLMMLWVTQAANQANQYTYNSSGGFLFFTFFFPKRMKDLLWQQHRKDRNMWADGRRASFGQVNSLN